MTFDDQPRSPTDPLQEEPDLHPADLGRHLDRYLAAVARELRARGVITGSPQRTEPTQRLIGSIVLDCTALRIASWTPARHRSMGEVIHPDRPAPVIVIWDEHLGWCAGLHHGPTRSTRRYLHPDLLPAATTVADFVVGMAIGETQGVGYPITARGLDRARLHLV